MDKPILEWKRRLRGMPHEQLTNAWSAKADQELSWTHEANFHAAAAERMKQLGNMAIDLDDKTRLTLCRQADEILVKLQRHLEDKPEQLGKVNQTASDSDAYHKAFGTKTARYYMYEQGVIDELGDRQEKSVSAL